MEPKFRLDLFAPTGEKFEELTDFLELGASVRVNSYGVLKAMLSGKHKALAQLTNNSQVEFFYKYDGENWTSFFGGIYRAQFQKQPNEPYFTLTALGYLWLLKTRIIAYPALVANKTSFAAVKAETIMKSLVTANITSAATVANGRLRDGTNWPSTLITVQADAAGGATQDWYCDSENLLASLQRLSPIAGGDFDLVKTSGSTFDFRFYNGQMGADRTSTVKFSIGLGNMGEPDYSFDRTNEATVAIVGGPGEDAVREFATRTGAGYGTGNDIEVFVPATNVESGNSAGLASAGDLELQKRKATESFEFKVIQTLSTRFGKDYLLGDKVTAVNPYTNTEVVQKITGASIGMQKGGEVDFSIVMEEPHV